MKSSDKKLPQRPSEHIIGDRAVNAFNYHRPQEWVANPANSDYGWDVFVEILAENSVKEPFMAQVKGSDSLSYIRDGEIISLPLSVSNIRYLLDKTMPIMIVVCDTSKSDDPVYWAWLNDVIEEIQTTNPSWKSQESVTVHVPTSNILSRISKDSIEEYVIKFHVNLKINAEIGAVIMPSFGIDHSKNSEIYREKPEVIISDKILSTLKNVGLIDVFEEESGQKIENLKPDDQKRFQELSDVSNCLTRFHDRDAAKSLDKIGKEIQNASNSIKAQYYNCKGVLALHLGDFPHAVELFTQVISLRPTEPKYETNLLMTQHYLSTKNPSTYNIPTDWASRLEALLIKHPEFAPANRLKAYWLSETKGSKTAETFLRASKNWEKELLKNLVCIAEIYECDNNFIQASSMFQEAQKTGLPFDALSWSLRGFIHFRMALPECSITQEIRIHGYGPSPLNISQLEKSKHYYNNAFEKFVEIGFPLISEETVANYSTVLALFGEQEKLVSVCKSFLLCNPESTAVQTALGLALTHQGRAGDAVPYFRRVFQSNEESVPVFKNLILSLLQSEEFEELLEYIIIREKKGFKNKYEEAFSRTFAAMALSEIGEMDQAQEQVTLLKSEPSMLLEGFIAEAEVLRRSGGSVEDVTKILRSAVESFPQDYKLLMLLVNNLGFPTNETADEIIRLLTKISYFQQLIPEQYSTLANAYLEKDRPDDAYTVLEKAIERYPREKQFLYEQSFVLMRLGDEDASFNTLQQYLKTGERTYHALHNTAIMAMESGRVEDAIKLFELAVKKAKESKERGEIHCQLHLLKKHCGYSSKEILRHAIEYGKTTKDDLAAEARFLTMCMLTPEVDIQDLEVNEWIKGAAARREKFSKENPRYHSFMSFKFPEGSPKEKLESMITEIISLTLPRELATASFRQSARNQIWPLVLRANYFLSIKSLFEFWERCIHSDEFTHAIHIWSDLNNLDVENSIVLQANSICIDLTALLTLAEFDLLSQLNNLFDRIFIASGTKLCLVNEHFNPQSTHPLAEKIYQWYLANRKIIRVRDARSHEDSDDREGVYFKGPTGLWIERQKSLDKLLGGGVGETLLLSRKLGLALYSDESIIRHWASSEYQTKSFCSLSIMNRFLASKIITEGRWILLLTQMIEKNFRIIPINDQLLMASLKIIINKRKELGEGLPSNDDLIHHPIFGVLLKQFGDTALNVTYLYNLATDWWISILSERELPIDCLSSCMQFPTYALSMRTGSTVIKGFVQDEQEERIAFLWALFLWKNFIRNNSKTPMVWHSIKSCCHELFPQKPHLQEDILFKLVPKSLVKLIEREPGITSDKKLNSMIMLPLYFPNQDRYKLESALRSLCPSFI